MSDLRAVSLERGKGTRSRGHRRSVSLVTSPGRIDAEAAIAAVSATNPPELARQPSTPVGGSPRARRRTPGTTSLSIPRGRFDPAESGAKEPTELDTSALTPKLSILASSLVSTSLISVVTPTSAFSVNTPVANAYSADVVASSAASFSVSLDSRLRSEISGPSTATLVESSASESESRWQESVQDDDGTSIEGTVSTTAGPSGHRKSARKNRNLSVSTQRSLSVSVVPPPTSVLWGHNPPPPPNGTQQAPNLTADKVEGENFEQGRLGELKQFTLWETKTVRGRVIFLEGRKLNWHLLPYSALLSCRFQHVADALPNSENRPHPTDRIGFARGAKGIEPECRRRGC